MTKTGINTRKSFKFFFSIFLVSLFPLHFWATIMIFRDLEFVSERTDMWAAIGYGGYSLLFALLESIAVAIVLWGASFLLPRKWGRTQTLSIIGSFFIILAGASIVDMAAHAFNDIRVSKQYLYGLEHFTSLTYALIFAAVLIALVASLLLILKTQKGKKIFADIFERIMLLSYFYLVIDLAGIVVVVIRNLT